MALGLGIRFSLLFGSDIFLPEFLSSFGSCDIVVWPLMMFCVQGVFIWFLGAFVAGLLRLLDNYFWVIEISRQLLLNCSWVRKVWLNFHHALLVHWRRSTIS